MTVDHQPFTTHLNHHHPYNTNSKSAICQEWQDLAHIFYILRDFQAENVKMLRKLHLEFEQT